MDSRKLLEQCIDDQLKPLAEKIASEGNQKVEDVLRALDGLKNERLKMALNAKRAVSL